MSKYQIIAEFAIQGTFEAENEQEALDICATRWGFKDKKDMEKIAGQFYYYAKLEPECLHTQSLKIVASARLRATIESKSPRKNWK